MNYDNIEAFFEHMEEAKATELSINYGDTTAFFYIDKDFEYVFWDENTLFIISQSSRQIIDINSISSMTYELEEDDLMRNKGDS